MMTNENVRFYLALVASMIYVANQHKDKPLLARATISGISGAVAYSTAPELHVLTGYSPILLVILIGVFSYAILDVTGSLLADRKLVIAAVKARLGVK